MRKITNKLHPKNWFKEANETTLTPQSGAKLFFLELIKLGLLAVVTIFLVRYFLFKPFYVRGASMEPNFYDKEYLIIDELTYRFKPPARGEVVVVRSPLNRKEYFLKRIIGLPGERIKIEDNRVIIYNDEHPSGFVLEEEYLLSSFLTMHNISVAVGTEKYFVMGDNRSSSLDSRNLGTIDKSALVGRVFLRGWPFDRAQLFIKWF